MTPIPGTGPLDFLAGWSPDGLSVLLVTRSEVNREVVLLRLADGERTNLTRDPAEDDSPVFSPDGRAILFVSDRVDRTPQLFRLDLSTGVVSQLTNLYRGAADPIVSPDGQLVAYAAERDADRWDRSRPDAGRRHRPPRGEDRRRRAARGG